MRLKKAPQPIFDCDTGPFVNQIRIKIPRRALFSAVADDLRARNQLSEGKPVYVIEDTAEMDMEEFLRLRPALARGAKISLVEGFVHGLPYNDPEPLVLFRADSPALGIFNGFNGKTTIEEIIAVTAQTTGWEENKATAVVRGLFLKLCEVRICQPG